MTSRFSASLLSKASPALSTKLLATRAAPPARFFSASPKTASPEAVVTPSRPFGAFRGGILGFLTGAMVAGVSIYYYVIDEYRDNNATLTKDISALQRATENLNSYVLELEQLVSRIQK